MLLKYLFLISKSSVDRWTEHIAPANSSLLPNSLDVRKQKVGITIIPLYLYKAKTFFWKYLYKKCRRLKHQLSQCHENELKWLQGFKV